VFGLYDYRARYYDPVLGRFISADTVVPEPGNPQALNRYAYVYNNPVRYTDPSGHWLETAWDIANIAWDIYEVRRDPSLLNIGALVVDVGAAVLPFVPAGVGMVVRGGKAAKAAVEVASHADEAVDAAKIGAKVAEEVAEEAAERVGKEAAEETTQRLIRHHLATNKNWIRDPGGRSGFKSCLRGAGCLWMMRRTSWNCRPNYTEGLTLRDITSGCMVSFKELSLAWKTRLRFERCWKQNYEPLPRNSKLIRSG